MYTIAFLRIQPAQIFYTGETISKKAKECGLNVIPGICGHGIGRYFHEFPQISHEG